MPKHGTKNALFGYFQTGIFVILEISTLDFVKRFVKILTHTMNFGIGSTIFKGPVSTFYLGASPDPVYKVCQKKKSIVVNQLVRS